MRATHCLIHALFLWLASASLATSRRPLVRAPRDAALTGEHLIVADKSLSSEEFRALLARVSKLSSGGTVRSYVENVAKVITTSLSPYALEMVSPRARFAFRATAKQTAPFGMGCARQLILQA